MEELSLCPTCSSQMFWEETTKWLDTKTGGHPFKKMVLYCLRCQMREEFGKDKTSPPSVSYDATDIKYSYWPNLCSSGWISSGQLGPNTAASPSSPITTDDPRPADALVQLGFCQYCGKNGVDKKMCRLCGRTQSAQKAVESPFDRNWESGTKNYG